MSELTPEQQFEECLKKAKEIVASYRAEAPEGCDPQNTWVAVATTVISTGASIYSANKQQKAANKAAASQQKAFGNAQGYLNSLASGEMGSLADIFGSELDPEAFLYEPVDITQSQLDTISGNIQAFPSALQLTNTVNPSIWRNDLSRIRTLMPGYDNTRDMYLGATNRLLSGQLPFQDVEDIVSNRSSIAASLGSPGGSRNATLRDLGLSRMDAINQGGSMFQQFIQMAEAISPVSSQMRPQQMMFTPQERLQSDILQRSLEQQGRASAAMAEAMPDPAQNALANANIGLNMAQLGASYQPASTAGSQALAQGIAGAAGMFGSIYGMRSQQTPSFNGYGVAGGSLQGSGNPVSATPFTTGQSYYGSAGGGIAAMGNGVGYNAQGMSSFIPTGTNSSGMSSSLFPSYQQSWNSSMVPSNSVNPYVGPYVPTQGYAQAGLGGYGNGWYNNGYAGPWRNF